MSTGRRQETHDFGILLGLAYEDFVIELNQYLAARGFDRLRPSFGYVFRALAADSLTATELAARLDITAQGAAKLIDEMVAAGYVERRRDPTDARARRLALTRRGRNALAAARRFHRAFEARLRARHGRAAVATVRALLSASLAGDAAGGPRWLRLRQMV